MIHNRKAPIDDVKRTIQAYGTMHMSNFNPPWIFPYSCMFFKRWSWVHPLKRKKSVGQHLKPNFVWLCSKISNNLIFFCFLVLKYFDIEYVFINICIDLFVPQRLDRHIWTNLLVVLFDESNGVLVALCSTYEFKSDNLTSNLFYYEENYTFLLKNITIVPVYKVPY